MPPTFDSDRQAVRHIPVLLSEVLHYMEPTPAGIYLDATCGGGGHTRALLHADPTCKLIACDWDKESLEEHGQRLLDEYPGRVTLIWTNFARIGFHLKRLGIEQIDGILADFGTSRFQIERSAGFSCSRNTPLDMRMSPAHQQTTAAMILAQASTKELIHIIGTYGGERFAKDIAEALVAQRTVRPLRMTYDITQVIERIIPHQRGALHPATRTFQALRIVVNKELENISGLLATARTILRPGGRFVAISFHSGEDRIVKQEFTEHPLLWKVLTPRIITPTATEVSANPSARSARLRAALKI